MLTHIVQDINTVEEKYRILYIKQADGSYRLDENVVVDTSGLKSTNAALKAEKQALQDKIDEIKKAEQQAKEKALLEGQKFEELLKLKETNMASQTAAFKSEIATLTKERDTLKSTLENHVKRQTVDEISQVLAGPNAALIRPHVEARIAMNTVDGIPTISYLNADGNPGASKDDVLASFRQNNIFKTVLLGRNSSGGGAGNNGTGNGSGDFSSYEASFDPNSDSYDTFKQQELKEKNKAAHDAFVKKYRLDDPYPI